MFSHLSSCLSFLFRPCLFLCKNLVSSLQEPPYWWFELFNMVVKAMMTGGMVIIGHGTSVQYAVGVLILLVQLLMTLKLAPYQRDSDDWSSFIAHLAQMLTSFTGLILMTDTSEDPTYDLEIVGVLLVAMNVLCLVVQVGILLVADCGLLKRRVKMTVVIPSTTKVMPLPAALQQEQSSKLATLKQIRLKHGAASAEYQVACAEYQAAAQKIQVQTNNQEME